MFRQQLVDFVRCFAIVTVIISIGSVVAAPEWTPKPNSYRRQRLAASPRNHFVFWLKTIITITLAILCLL